LPEKKIDWNLKVLHITNWYPSKPTPQSAPFIKKQIEALSQFTENSIWHIEIKRGEFNLNRGSNDNGSQYWIIYLPFEIWRINEWISFCMVLWILLKENTRKYDVINFHVAYPNCIYIRLLNKFIHCPIVITEHWSAYHFNFGTKKKLHRVQRIFRQEIPVITVSKALGKDIKEFSGADFPVFILPNVVRTEIFHYDPEIKKKPNVFFMVSQWKWPKDPFTVIKGWPKILEILPDAVLRIGGYGPQLVEMQNIVKTLKLENCITLLGHLKPEKIAEEMNQAYVLIHLSEYETFSIVCAEAISCGTPVIASKVGGIPEVVGDDGILINGSSIQDWIIAMQYITKKPIKISSDPNRFSTNVVGQQYYKVLQKVISAFPE